MAHIRTKEPSQQDISLMTRDDSKTGKNAANFKNRIKDLHFPPSRTIPHLQIQKT